MINLKNRGITLKQMVINGALKNLKEITVLLVNEVSEERKCILLAATANDFFAIFATHILFPQNK